MRSFVLCTALAALLAAPAVAASPETDAFVANTRLAVGFLNASSALASDRSDDSAVRATSDDELRTLPHVLAALDRRTLPPLIPPQAVASLGDGLQTGRSVATDAPVSTDAFASPIGTGAMMPAAFITIDRLAASRGRAFDTLYTAAQLAVLADLKAAYDVYARTGDDPVLQQVARNEAVTAESRIAALKSIATDDDTRD